MPPPSTLPLSSLLAVNLPSHPLPQLVFDPVLSRLAQLEALLLLSRPSTLLQRLGASEQTVVGLIGLAFLGGLARWRRQWRAFMMLLGVGEAVGRTLTLIDQFNLRKKDDVQEEEEETLSETQADQTTLYEELQHLLSFWTLFFSLSLLESLRASPSPSSLVQKSPIKTRFFNSLKSLRYTYLRFLRLWIVPIFYRSRYAYLALMKRHPRFDLSTRFPPFPSVPFARQFAHLLTPHTYFPRPSSSSSFPQPLPASSELSTFLQHLPLPHTYFSSSPTTSRLKAEFRWEVIKLLILWTGLRKDSFGAKSVLFDWILGPIVQSRRGGSKKRVTEDTADRGFSQRGPKASVSKRNDDVEATRLNNGNEIQGYSTSLNTNQDHLSLSSSTSHSRSSSHDRLPRPPPIWTTQTPPRPSLPPPGAICRKPFQPPRTIDVHEPPSDSTRSSIDTTTSSSSQGGGRRRGRGAGGRDSLLLESPPRSLRDAFPDHENARRRRSYSSDATSEEEFDEKEKEEGAESPARTEAEEGIKRWATVLRLQQSETALNIVGEELGDGPAVKGLEAVGRGWSV
ncbi:hypothetical protein JCM3765_000696 [Sporobolomyces pararoseus]